MEFSAVNSQIAAVAFRVESACATADKTADKYEIGGEGVALMVGHLIGFWLAR